MFNNSTYVKSLGYEDLIGYKIRKETLSCLNTEYPHLRESPNGLILNDDEMVGIL